MAEIVVHLGARTHTLPAGSSLADLVASLGHRPEAVATGRNGDFVRREERAGTLLQAGDQVSVFHAIVGG